MKNLLSFLFSTAVLVLLQSGVMAQSSSSASQLEGFSTLMDQNDGPREPTSTSSGGVGLGGGERKSAIVADWFPFTKLISTNTRISWQAPAAVKKFHLTVSEDRPNGEVFYQIVTSSKSHNIPLSEMQLDPNKDYVVQIKSATGTTASNQYAFSIVPSSVLSDAMNELKSNDEYKGAKPHVQNLMKAYVMEGLQLNLQALKMYEKFNSDDKIDVLYRNMKDRFLERVSEQED